MAKSVTLILVLLLVGASIAHNHDCTKDDPKWSEQNCGHCMILNVDPVIGIKTCSKCKSGYYISKQKQSTVGEPDKTCESVGLLVGVIIISLLVTAGMIAFCIWLHESNKSKKYASSTPSETK